MANLTGFYGKLPSHGDFISRSLPRTFIDPWDTWLQASISSSKERLGQSWLDYFLVFPIWRFILSDGICGDGAWVGIMCPSVDRVGRYFPITVATHVTSSVKPVALIDECQPWLDQIEKIVLSSLNNTYDIDQLLVHLQAINEPVLERINEVDQPLLIHDEKRFHGHFSMDPVNNNPFSAFPAISHFFIEQSFHTYSLWWASGTDDIKPSLLICEGLPKYDGFSSFLDGDWDREPWNDIKSLFVVGDTPAFIGV